MNSSAGEFNGRSTWPLVALDDLCERKIGVRDPGLRPDDSFTYVDISSVDNTRKQIVAPKTLLGRDASSRARQIILEHDVLVATTRPNLNAVAIVSREFHGQMASTGFCVLRPRDQLDADYLFNFVQSTDFVHRLSDLVKGALYPAVTEAQVRAQRIPLPSLNEQHRIALRLRDQLAAVSKARAAVEAQLADAEALPAAQLRAVFQSFEAQSWPRRELSECAELLPARSIATAGDAAVQTITTACLTEIGFDCAGIKGARMWSDDVESSKVSPGEILIARSNTPELVGRATVYRGEAEGVVASDLLIRLGCRATTDANFLSGFLSSLYVTGYWRERASGASGTMKKITRAQLENLAVPAPGRTEQEAIADQCGAAFATSAELQTSLRAKLAEIEKLSAAVLRAAFQPPS
jgi:type I restriction enzyme, S subunit